MSYFDRRDRDSGFGIGRTGIGVAVAVILAAIVGLMYVFNSYGRVEPGFVGLVRNGGPFDNRDVIKLITPSDGRTNIGYDSTISEYPTSERFDNVAPGVYGQDPSAGDTLDTDRYRTRTLDGYDVGVQGRWTYTLNTDQATLTDFDQKYGTRTYAVPGADPNSDNSRVKVSDGDQGMAVFIASQLRPTEEESVRQGIGATPGAQLDPSLGLLTVNSTDPGEIAKANANLANGGGSSGQTFTNLSASISKVGLERINGQLGAKVNQPYFTNVTFTLQAIALSPDTSDKVQQVRDSIAALAKANADSAAAVAQATGRAQAAAQDAQANKNAQEGYNACSTCAQKELIQAQGDAQAKANDALKGAGIQVYAPGNGNTQLQIPVK